MGVTVEQARPRWWNVRRPWVTLFPLDGPDARAVGRYPLMSGVVLGDIGATAEVKGQVRDGGLVVARPAGSDTGAVLWPRGRLRADASALLAWPAMDPRTPVLVGAGQVSHHAAGLDDALEPAALMAEAVERAAADAKLAGVPAADSLRVVSLLSWRYRDPARFVAAASRADAEGDRVDDAGRQQPADCWSTSRRRRSSAASSTSPSWPEARRGGRGCGPVATKRVLMWPKLPEGTGPDRTIGHELVMSSPGELARGLVMPVQLYPMFETALRAAAGESIDEHLVRVSELWSRFSAVAASNPYAWIQEAKSAEEIRTPGPGEPHDRAALPEVHELQQRRRPGRGGDHVLRRAGPRAGCPRGSLGVPARRARTATSIPSSPTVGRWRRRRPSGLEGGRRWSWPGSASTTSSSSTSTRASRRRCSWARRRSGWRWTAS